MKTYHSTTLAAHALLVSTLTPEGYTVEPIPYFEGDKIYPNPSVEVKKGIVSFWVNLPSPDSYANKDRIIVKPHFERGLRDHLPYAYSNGDKRNEIGQFTLAHDAAPARLLKRFEKALADYLPAFTETLERKANADERANETLNAKFALSEAGVLFSKYSKYEKESLENASLFYLNAKEEYYAKVTVHAADRMEITLGGLDAEKVIKLANFLKTL